MNFKFFISALFFIISTTLPAQELFNIKGTIIDQEQAAISEAEVFVLSGTGNTIIKTEVVTNGSFSIESLPKGSYILQVVSNGYEDVFHPLALEKNEELKLLLTKTSDYKLDEVVVTSSKKTFINKNGNTKVNVKGSIFEAVPNPIDLLQKLPGVQISLGKDAIGIVGRGNALIYIDKQKATVNDVSALSVADIESIEIIKNPSSKYEAEGRAVILITRVKSSRQGFEMGVAETASFRKRFNNYLGINPSYKNGNLELRGNINYNHLNPWEGLSNSFDLPAEQWSSSFDAESYTKRKQVVLGGALYYAFNADDYLSFNVNGRIQKDDDTNTANTHTVDQDTIEDVITMNNNDEKRNFTNAYINYNNKLTGINGNLFAGLQYSKFSQRGQSVIKNNFNETEFELTQDRYQAFDVEVFTGRVDFEKKISDMVNLEAGALHLMADATTDFRINDFVSDGSTSSLYLFKEYNSSAYTQVTGSIKKVSYTAGIRAEITDIEGRFDGEATPAIDKHYTNFFPKAQLSIPLDSLRSLSFNYAKSIARPNYSSTSQTSIYTNPYVIFSRNLNLDPTITDEVSAGFQYKNKSVNLNFFRIKNPVYFGYVYDTSNNIIDFSSMNYELERGFNLEFVIPFSYKIWSNSNTISVILNEIKDPKAMVNSAKPYLYYYSNHMFKLSSGYTLMASGWGYTERNSGAFKRNALFTMDLAATKTFAERLDVTLSFNDIFRGMKFKETVSINDINSRATFYLDAREISLSLRYTFGRLKDSQFKDKRVNENSNRIN